MAAAQWAQQGPGARAGAQPVGPGARGIDHAACAHGVALPLQGILQLQARHATLFEPQSARRHVVEGGGAEPPRLLQHAQHQAGVVGLGVLEDQRAAQARRRQAGREHLRGGQVGVEVAALSGHQVVQRQAGLHEPAPRLAAGAVGEQKALRLHQAGGFVQQAIALAHRVQRGLQVAFLQVAQPAVHQFG